MASPRSRSRTEWKLLSICASPDTKFLHGNLDFNLTRTHRVVIHSGSGMNVHQECSASEPVVSRNRLSLRPINCYPPLLFQASISDHLDNLGVDPAPAKEITSAILCFLQCAVGRPIDKEFHVSVDLEVTTIEENYDRVEKLVMPY